MNSLFIKTFILIGMLIGLPAMGILLTGFNLSRYLEFPPYSRYVEHAPFSWLAFAIIAIFVLASILFPLLNSLGSIRSPNKQISGRLPFPWWGWLGVWTGMISWILAWTRFSWFEDLQPHTFTPLWLSYIITVNGLSYQRKGSCMMTGNKYYFALLFPASSIFWWFFEYLNRFVQNWYYAGIHFGPGEYFLYATLSFSTVLPAVLSTREWLLTFPFINEGFKSYTPIKFSKPKLAAWVVLIFSASGLTFLGVWPNVLFPFVWISPLLIIISMKVLSGQSSFLSQVNKGDWRLIISSALGSLFCGFFWEMWNYWSLAKWEYSIPFVHRFEIFEMPLLGYAGYLPFGLECAVIGWLLEDYMTKTRLFYHKDIS
ncbi:hypothetical protein ACFL2O_05580 [Thermodesulfobacteriota bacterium]